MNAKTAQIRPSRDGERDSILDMHRKAFGEGEGPEIAKLVSEMLDDPSSQPRLSLVAEIDGQLVGHVLYTAVRLEPNSEQAKCQILAPVAVVPDRQREGIGSRLIREGFKQLADTGVDLVFVLGYPEYYSRFGFRPAGKHGLQAPYPIAAKNVGAWMVTELVEGAIAAN